MKTVFSSFAEPHENSQEWWLQQTQQAAVQGPGEFTSFFAGEKKEGERVTQSAPWETVKARIVDNLTALNTAEDLLGKVREKFVELGIMEGNTNQKIKDIASAYTVALSSILMDYKSDLHDTIKDFTSLHCTCTQISKAIAMTLTTRIERKTQRLAEEAACLKTEKITSAMDMQEVQYEEQKGRSGNASSLIKSILLKLGLKS